MESIQNQTKRIMRKIFTTILIVAISAASAFAANFNNEEIHYKVMFKWGLIHKQAGSATLSTRDNGDKFLDGKLTASSASWADKFYKVRDTLTVTMDKKTFLPTVYQKIAHEGSEHNRDKVVFTKQGDTTIGQCTHVGRKNGKLVSNETSTVEAVGATVDMLSSFYYMRALPYSTWNPGHVQKLNVFSGYKKELLSIKYHGIETVELDGVNYQCYKITFMFTSDGRTKSSDDMEAWIDTRNLIPIKLVGKLPVGSVQALYVP